VEEVDKRVEMGGEGRDASRVRGGGGYGGWEVLIC